MDLDSLQKRAEAVKSKLGSLDYPIAVEFAGSPKAGKSTTIDTVLHFFKRCGFKVWGPTEGASKRTPYHLRRNLVAFNSWTLNYAIQELLVAYYNVDAQHLVILDRGPFDSLAWMRWLHARGDLTKNEYETIEQFALHPKWTNLMSRVFLFTCQPDISLQREHAGKLTLTSGTAMNPETLNQLLNEYEGLKKSFESDGRVIHHDTSQSVSPLETSYHIAENILRVFEQRLCCKGEDK